MATPTTFDNIRDDRAAIDKAFSLLIAFGDDAGTGLGVSELARRTSLSKSTAFRVLGMLERNSMVERVGTSYRLGARLNELGRAVYAPGHDRLRDMLLPFLTELFDATRHTTHLGVLHGTDVLYLAKLYGHRTVATPSRIGDRLPANCTAVGKALLAYHPDIAESAQRFPLRRLTPESITDPDVLTAQLGQIRRVGVALDHEESRTGVCCVAAPILARNGRAYAALSISGLRGTEFNGLTTQLRHVCAAAAQALDRTSIPLP